MSYKAVLVGLGQVALTFGRDEHSDSSLSHADSFRSNGSVDLIGGYSPLADDIQRFVKMTGLKGFTDLTEMLKETKPDIVSICSPTSLHAEQTEICINKKIPMIWLEKPPVEKLQELIYLEQIRTANETPTKILVNYFRRYHPAYNRLKKLIKEKHYGNVRAVNLSYSRGLTANGLHMLDMIFYIFGDKKYQILWSDDLTDKSKNPSFILRLESGIPIYVTGTDTSYHNIDIVVTTEKGRYSIIHGGMTTKIEEKVEHELFPGYYRLIDVSNEKLGPGGFQKSFDYALSDLIDAFENESLPQSNLKTSFPSQELLEAIVSKQQ